MEVLPRRRRQIYLFLLTVTFIIMVPVLALYASGYRLSDDFTIIKTGGIHVNIPSAGASFYLDDGFEGNGSIFQKSFFIQNLVPDSYTVRIEKEGYHSWRKQLEVFPTVITDARALLVPTQPALTEIPETLPVNGSATTGARVSEQNSRYTQILSLFSATSTGVLGAPLGATTTIQYQQATTTVYERGGVGLWLDENGLHAWWLEDEEESPYIFCYENQECTREILVWDRANEIRHFDFLPNDNLFVLLERPDGIVATELDTRVPQNTFPVYLKEGAQFRIAGGSVYVLDGEELFEVEL